MEAIFTTENIFSLLTLTLMEIVLGIDNIVFISIITNRVAADQQNKARVFGLALALITRIILLFMVSWLVHLTEPLFEIFNKEISIKDLILIAGGLFLVYKSTTEIFNKMETHESETVAGNTTLTFASAIGQIILLDIIFSIDSIITAVGLVDSLYIMIIAVVLSMVVMLIFSKGIGTFINNNPSVKIIALAFLVMIGTMLLAEGFHIHFPKGYIYFSMAFALAIEFLNMKMRGKFKKIKKTTITHNIINN